jgi:hypothetical protein
VALPCPRGAYYFVSATQGTASIDIPQMQH